MKEIHKKLSGFSMAYLLSAVWFIVLIKHKAGIPALIVAAGMIGYYKYTKYSLDKTLLNIGYYCTSPISPALSVFAKSTGVVRLIITGLLFFLLIISSNTTNTITGIGLTAVILYVVLSFDEQTTYNFEVIPKGVFPLQGMYNNNVYNTGNNSVFNRVIGNAPIQGNIPSQVNNNPVYPANSNTPIQYPQAGGQQYIQSQQYYQHTKPVQAVQYSQYAQPVQPVQDAQPSTHTQAEEGITEKVKKAATSKVQKIANQIGAEVVDRGRISADTLDRVNRLSKTQSQAEAESVTDNYARQLIQLCMDYEKVITSLVNITPEEIEPEEVPRVQGKPASSWTEVFSKEDVAFPIEIVSIFEGKSIIFLYANVTKAIPNGRFGSVYAYAKAGYLTISEAIELVSKRRGEIGAHSNDVFRLLYTKVRSHCENLASLFGKLMNDTSVTSGNTKNFILREIASTASWVADLAKQAEKDAASEESKSNEDSEKSTGDKDAAEKVEDSLEWE